ncbi:hypothetical protein FACS189454_08550 [Planctomycetales bacterium]|nr:hypothetical protein FACS189454_08550 [Planctomycetales bacterium]
MSQYEKHSWCLGIIPILTAIFGLFALFAFETKNAFEWWSLFNICFFAAIMVGHSVAPRPKEYTEDEKRLSDKATAWTFYGLVTTIFITVFLVAVFLEGAIIPETITITVTKDTIEDISIFAVCMVVLALGVQSLLLAVFLRRATKQNGENKEPENDVWERIKK